MKNECETCGYEWDAVTATEECPGCNMPEMPEPTEEEIENMYREAEGLPPVTVDEPF